LLESPHLSDNNLNNSMPPSTSTCSRRTSSLAENKKAQDRWGKEEEKLLVQLWAEKHEQLESRKENMGLDRWEDFEITRNQQDGRQMQNRGNL